MLSRQKKIPKLDKLLARKDGKKDVRMYLDGLKAGLPGITMEDWRRRVAARTRTDTETETATET